MSAGGSPALTMDLMAAAAGVSGTTGPVGDGDRGGRTGWCRRPRPGPRPPRRPPRCTRRCRARPGPGPGGTAARTGDRSGSSGPSSPAGSETGGVGRRREGWTWPRHATGGPSLPPVGTARARRRSRPGQAGLGTGVSGSGGDRWRRSGLSRATATRMDTTAAPTVTARMPHRLRRGREPKASTVARASTASAVPPRATQGRASASETPKPARVADPEGQVPTAHGAGEEPAARSPGLGTDPGPGRQGRGDDGGHADADPTPGRRAGPADGKWTGSTMDKVEAGRPFVGSGPRPDGRIRRVEPVVVTTSSHSTTFRETCCSPDVYFCLTMLHNAKARTSGGGSSQEGCLDQ